MAEPLEQNPLRDHVLQEFDERNGERVRLEGKEWYGDCTFTFPESGEENAGSLSQGEGNDRNRYGPRTNNQRRSNAKEAPSPTPRPR